LPGATKRHDTVIPRRQDPPRRGVTNKSERNVRRTTGLSHGSRTLKRLLRGSSGDRHASRSPASDFHRRRRGHRHLPDRPVSRRPSKPSARHRSKLDARQWLRNCTSEIRGGCPYEEVPLRQPAAVRGGSRHPGQASNKVPGSRTGHRLSFTIHIATASRFITFVKCLNVMWRGGGQSRGIVLSTPSRMYKIIVDYNKRWWRRGSIAKAVLAASSVQPWKKKRNANLTWLVFRSNSLVNFEQESSLISQWIILLNSITYSKLNIIAKSKI